MSIGNDKSAKNIILKTGPCDTQTHWYQTVFLLPERIKIKNNEKIKVELNASRCIDLNPREYDVFISLTFESDDFTHEIRQIYHLNSRAK